ncbi:MAG: sigma-70 family RNA polymerase sigma factor [Planctomycetaceae bacterium]
MTSGSNTGSNTGSNAEIDRPRTAGQDESPHQADRALHRPDRLARDLALVRRLLAQDDLAWQQFVRKYERLIYRGVYAAAAELQLTIQCADQIEDICAEVFSSLVQRKMTALRQFSGRSRLSTWLAVVTRRIALRSLYRITRSARQADSAEIGMLTVDSVSSAPDQSGRLRKLQHGMQKLSADDQRVLTLFYDRQFSYQQVAEELGISANAVGPKLDRARRRLRNVLRNTPTPFQEFDFITGPVDDS